MFIGTLGASMLVAMMGQHVWEGAVVKIEQWKADGIWFVEFYVGSVERYGPNGELDRNLVRLINVDPKHKDPRTGRLLIDEMRELLKSRRLVWIRFNWNGRTAT